MTLDPKSAEEIDVAADKLIAYLNGPVFIQACRRSEVLSKELEDATGDLNDALAEAERVLVLRFHGHASAIEFNESSALVFWQVRGQWGLFVLDGHAHLTPLCNASRQRRQEAAFLLSDLTIQLQAESDSTNLEDPVAKVVRLEEAIREHRAAQGHDLCWENDTKLWASLRDGVVADRKVPPWPEFMTRCAAYRAMLDQSPKSPSDTLWVQDYTLVWHRSADPNGNTVRCGVSIPGSPQLSRRSDQWEPHPVERCPVCVSIKSCQNA